MKQVIGIGFIQMDGLNKEALYLSLVIQTDIFI